MMRSPSSSSSSGTASKKEYCSMISIRSSGRGRGRRRKKKEEEEEGVVVGMTIKRGPWTPEEDELLSGYIKREGEGQWRTLPRRAGLLRCGKSCRLRWMNYLRPSVKRGHISPDEEDLILRLHRLLGNRWSLIAGRIPGRTDNEIKNYWNTHLSKKLITQGIDPTTHKPLLPNNNNNNNHIIIPSSTSSSITMATNTAPNQIFDQFQKPNPYPCSNCFPTPNLDLDELEPTADQGVPNEAAAAQPIQHQYQGVMIPDGLSIDENNLGDDDEDDEYCRDDVFSSFFDSLINEDVFNGSTATATAITSSTQNQEDLLMDVDVAGYMG